MSTLYTTSVSAIGGRGGKVRSSDGLIDLQLAMPKELGGPGGKTNPEQLFAAGYAACFQSALALVARKQKVNLGDNTVTATVGIGPQGEGFGLTAALEVAIPGLDQATAEALVAAAHKVCPYSNATRGNIDVKLTVTT
jgi:osmotically inducible protein OsmC